MSNKNSLASFRMEVFKLLERRAHLIDPRSYKSFERNIFKVQRKNLENIRLV